MKEYVNQINLIYDVIHEIFAKMVDSVCIIVAGILSLIFSVTGGEDEFTKLLIIAMVIDYITGVTRSIITKKVNSAIGHRGILKKMMSICLIALAYQTAKVFGPQETFKSIVTKLLFSNECISILENCSICGIPMPKKLKEILEQYKNEMICKK